MCLVCYQQMWVCWKLFVKKYYPIFSTNNNITIINSYVFSLSGAGQVRDAVMMRRSDQPYDGKRGVGDLPIWCFGVCPRLINRGS
jgi:hypothetical protein